MPSSLVARRCSLAFVAGCSKSYIPNTDVEDTSDNRKVIAFCEEYRHAVEDKDVGKLLKLASPRYYEDGGNTNPEDDIDFDGLKDYLTSTFVKTQTIRYEIRYRKVTSTRTRRSTSSTRYSASYRIPGLKGEEWKHTVADNRLELVPEGGNVQDPRRHVTGGSGSTRPWASSSRTSRTSTSPSSATRSTTVCAS